MMRDSSPPLAPRCSGVSGAPRCGQSSSSTSSTPDAPNATRRSGSRRGRDGQPGLVRPLAHVDDDLGVGHGQLGELGGGGRGEPVGRGPAGSGQLGGGGRQVGQQPVVLGAECLHPLVVPVQLAEAGAGALQPVQDAVDVGRVLADQPGQLGEPLVGRLEADRVGLETGRVGREVGRGVGEEVGDLREPAAQLVEDGVAAVHAVERAPRAPASTASAPVSPSVSVPLNAVWASRAAVCKASAWASRYTSARRASSSPATGATASTSPMPNRSRSASCARSRLRAVTSTSCACTVDSRENRSP